MIFFDCLVSADITPDGSSIIYNNFLLLNTNDIRFWSHSPNSLGTGPPPSRYRLPHLRRQRSWGRFEGGRGRLGRGVLELQGLVAALPDWGNKIVLSEVLGQCIWLDDWGRAEEDVEGGGQDAQVQRLEGTCCSCGLLLIFRCYPAQAQGILRHESVTKETLQQKVCGLQQPPQEDYPPTYSP